MMKNYKTFITVFLLFFCATKSFSQNLYAGIEIGGRGLKVYIIDVRSVEKEIVLIENFWSDNINLLGGVIANGAISDNDMNITIQKVRVEYKKVLEEFKIDKNRIYVVISSGVAVANNIDTFVDIIKKEIDVTAGVITTEKESRFLFKSGVPIKFHDESLLLDIGSGNTKGGFLEKINGAKTFVGLNMNLGTVSLSELLNKENKLYNLNDFTAATDRYYPTLTNDLKAVFEGKSKSLDKKKIYISGGSAWAFYTLFYEDDTHRNFLEFSPDDVLKYEDELRNNFEKYTVLAKKNKEVARVLKTFTRENLVVSNSILRATIENIRDVRSKKLFFAKQPEVSWVVTYITDELAKEVKGSF